MTTTVVARFATHFWHIKRFFPAIGLEFVLSMQEEQQRALQGLARHVKAGSRFLISLAQIEHAFIGSFFSSSGKGEFKIFTSVFFRQNASYYLMVRSIWNWVALFFLNFAMHQGFNYCNIIYFTQLPIYYCPLRSAHLHDRLSHLQNQHLVHISQCCFPRRCGVKDDKEPGPKQIPDYLHFRSIWTGA